MTVLLLTNNNYSPYINLLVPQIRFFSPSVKIKVITDQSTKLACEPDKIVQIPDDCLSNIFKCFIEKLNLPHYMDEDDSYLFLDSDIVVSGDIEPYFSGYTTYTALSAPFESWSFSASMTKVQKDYSLTPFNSSIQYFPKDKIKQISLVFDRAAFHQKNNTFSDPDISGDEIFIALAIKEFSLDIDYVWKGISYLYPSNPSETILSHYIGRSDPIINRMLTAHIAHILHYNNIQFDKASLAALSSIRNPYIDHPNN